MIISDKTAESALLGFMRARCDVSSQHKLPTREEILGTITVELIGKPKVNQLLDELIADGRLVVYGPYISDHEIDVM